MAFSVLSSTSWGGSGTSSAIDTSAADFLIYWSAGGSSSAPTDSQSNTWTALTESNNGASIVGRFYWCQPGAKVNASHTFTNGGGGTWAHAVIALSGVKVTSPFDQQATNTTSGASPANSGSVTPAADHEIVFSGIALGGNGGTCSLGGSFTTREYFAPVTGTYYGAAIGYIIQTSAAAVNPQWSWSNGSSGAALASATFKVETPPASDASAALSGSAVTSGNGTSTPGISVSI